MISVVLIYIFLGIVPIVLGLPWTQKIKSSYSWIFAYIIGCFEEVALFQVICFPIVLSYGKFETFVIATVFPDPLIPVKIKTFEKG